MLSPNCPVIMDVTSTTSTYDTKEKNDHSKSMCNSVSDGKNGFTENELLEELNQDPDDEDTLSEDSLRLRVSDDEGETSQTGVLAESVTPHFSSEHAASQDIAMDSTDSNKIVPLINEVKSSVNKSFEAGSNKEHQRLTEINQTSSQSNNGNKNLNNMWHRGGRKEHFINTVRSPKQFPRNNSFHIRYHHGFSNTHRNSSYFNNYYNFGRPVGYRKHGSHWKYSKEKHVHGSKRNMQRNTMRAEIALESEPQSPSKSNMEIGSYQSEEFLVGAQFGYNNIRSTKSLNTTEFWSDDLWDTTTDNKNYTPPNNNELPEESNDAKLDQESTCDAGTLIDPSPVKSDSKDCENTSSLNFNSEFTSNEPPDKTDDVLNECKQCTQTSLSPNHDGCDSETIPTSSVKAAESLSSSEQKNKPATDDVSLPENNNSGFVNSTQKTIELDIGSKSKNDKPESNTEIDVSDVSQKEVNVNEYVTEAIEPSNETSSFESSKDLEPSITPVESHTAEDSVQKDPSDQYNHIDVQGKIEEQPDENGKEQPDESVKEQQLDGNDNKQNERKIEDKQTDNSLVNGQEVAKEAMEIVLNDQHTNEDGDRGTSNNAKKTSSCEKLIEVNKKDLQDPKTIKIVEDVVNELICDETMDKLHDNSQQNSTKKFSSNLASDDVKASSVLKRSLSEDAQKSIIKKRKIVPDTDQEVCSEQFENLITKNSTIEEKSSIPTENCKDTPKPLHYVRKFFQRDMKGKLTKLKREELEELIIQKLVETITMRSEIGRLREQARISERNQEATRIRCQQLAKQIKDFDMVLSRNAIDRRSNNDKPVPPIKINRSVGLQVNFGSEHGLQSLKTVMVNNAAKTNVPNPVTQNGCNATPVSENTSKATRAQRRSIKIRSPRRTEASKSSLQSAEPQTTTPSSLGIIKSSDTSHNLLLSKNSREQILPNVNSAQPTVAKSKGIVINGKISNQVNRPANVPNNRIVESSDLIDLTEEEDKNKSSSTITSTVHPVVGAVPSPVGVKVPHSKIQRVVQGSLPGNVAITTQSTNIRVVQSASQPTPTALVNNINATKLAYVMQGNTGTTRQLVITSNPNQVRPATSTIRGQFSNVAYNTGISTLANGTVRVLSATAASISNSQLPPAPLPDTPQYPTENGWKLPPPAPSLKISKVTQGIVLSWNMAHSPENHADIASYQLYAYQEIPGTPPNSNLWKKVGDVRALPLPMACTLKEFTPGNNYHFAVRAVDTYSRLGQYSIPRNISL